MPHRDLPADFEKRYTGSWTDAPWWELGDAEKAGQYYHWSLDELMFAAQLGFDGLGTNEHHQAVYGFWNNPNLFGATLAKLTHDQGLDDVAIVQLGATISSTSPPIRIAEEYAMIDCISGGRLVAGLPHGLGADANIAYGVPPMEQRERWREGIDLMIKAWTADEFFVWNGKHFQLPKVNLWPRPIQSPHPPLIIPGAASSSTWDYCHERDLPYAYLSYFGGDSAVKVMDRFWARAEEKGRDRNPYRAAFLQLVGVAETDAQAEKEFIEHVEYFYHKMLYIPPQYLAVPGATDYKSLINLFGSGMLKHSDYRELTQVSGKQMIEEGFAVVGSPETVRQRLEEMARRLNVGHLMTVLQFGSMGHEQAMRNIELFGREVLPHLQRMWDGDGWEQRWWPKRLEKTPVR
ncbi:LLM class flavin-dependent oxidoreductase [Geodermatophilus sp. SYSU D01186]